MSFFLLLLVALMLDRLLGEPRFWHPLAGFGRIVQALESLSLGRGVSVDASAFVLRSKGTVVALLLIAVPVAVFAGLSAAAYLIAPALYIALQVLCLYFCIGWRSLEQHGLAVWQALQEQNPPLARERVAMIVSRDTANMDTTAVATAATESILENGNDAIFAPIFWFCVGGAPAALAYRLANTLDAMWGYRTARFLHFGWFAAKLDDVLNFIPARLCAVSYCLAGHSTNAWRCWRTQAASCLSPNGGPVMTAGAGALGVLLGGPTHYHGILVNKPTFGCGLPANPSAIAAACALVNRSLLLWLALLGIMFGLAYDF